MADVSILDTSIEAAPKDYLIAGAQEIVLKGVTASFDGSGAAGSYVPAFQVLDPSGFVVGTYTCDTTLAAGASADVSWFPSVRQRTGVQPATPQYNIDELGFQGKTNLSNTAAMTFTLGSVAVGDGILVWAMAPENTGLGPPNGRPIACGDSVSNGYTAIHSFNWQDSPAVANTGIYCTVFWCPSSIGDMGPPFDFIDVIWNHNVTDKVVYAHGIRHDGGASTPTFLAATADNDAATFAASQMTLTAPNYTPPRDNGLEYAFLASAKTGGVGGFGAVVGYNGFFQDTFHIFAGTFQQYLIAWQTHGAVALFDPTTGLPTNEKDFGVLPGGVLVPAFNGVGQAYSAGANAWKGIALFGQA